MAEETKKTCVTEERGFGDEVVEFGKALARSAALGAATGLGAILGVYAGKKVIDAIEGNDEDDQTVIDV